MPSGAHLSSLQFNKQRDSNPHYGGSLDRFEEEMDDDFRHDDAERAARLEEEEDREIADYDESGQPVRNFPPRNQYLTPSTARNEQPEGERGPEQPEDEWGITDDDGSGRGGSKEEYEDFDFEGDDW